MQKRFVTQHEANGGYITPDIGLSHVKFGTVNKTVQLKVKMLEITN